MGESSDSYIQTSDRLISNLIYVNLKRASMSKGRKFDMELKIREDPRLAVRSSYISTRSITLSWRLFLLILFISVKGAGYNFQYKGNLYKELFTFNVS